MGLSWGRKSAAPPVSSPARQDRCKVGGKKRESEQIKVEEADSSVRTEDGDVERKDDGRVEKEKL